MRYNNRIQMSRYSLIRRVRWKYPIIISVVFVMTMKAPSDSDLGWHLRYGQYFWETGRVLRDNITSFVWPDYQWVEASWGYDVLIYAIYAWLGFFGLSVATALISTSVFVIVTVPWRHRSLWNLLFLVGIFASQTAPTYYSGIRSQTLSTLFFTLVFIVSMRLLSHSPSLLPASRFTLHALRFTLLSYLSLPFLFFLWANTHGGFVLGLLVLTTMWVTAGLVSVVHHRREITTTLMSGRQWAATGVTLAASWLTPLLNPWGVRLYEESLRHSTNINLAGIVEWIPLFPQFKIEGIVTTSILAIVLLVALRRRNLHDLPFFLGYAIITILSYQAVRFLILFGVMSTWYLAQHLNGRLFGRLDRPVLRNAARLGIIGFLLFGIINPDGYFKIPNGWNIRYSWEDFCSRSFFKCSEELSRLMGDDPPEGNGFHPYEYGGYLSFRVPQVKTFLDGRMAAWERNGDVPPVLHGDNVLDREPVWFRRFDSEYHFQWMILPTSSAIIPYVERLVDSGVWDRRFKDDNVVYYVKVRD